MNTETIAHFHEMESKQLMPITGGVSTKCVASIIAGSVWGGSRGLAGGPIAGGIGTVVDAAAGAIIGCR